MTLYDMTCHIENDTMSCHVMSSTDMTFIKFTNNYNWDHCDNGTGVSLKVFFPNE